MCALPLDAYARGRGNSWGRELCASSWERRRADAGPTRQRALDMEPYSGAIPVKNFSEYDERSRAWQDDAHFSRRPGASVCIRRTEAPEQARGSREVGRGARTPDAPAAPGRPTAGDDPSCCSPESRSRGEPLGPGKRKHRTLFVIDPQRDFHSGGSLGIPGADEDSARIAGFIRSNIDAIDEIYVSLDSHHRIHIAHGIFWKNDAGNHPPPFTLIRNEDVAAGTWTPVDVSKRDYALAYTRALEEKGRFVLRIWPEHCLVGTQGHAVVPVLNEALQEWVYRKMKPVEYIHKGLNCLTEMYSAIAAEVPLSEDPSTHSNHQLLRQLHRADELFFCGEAKSHCVNYTMRDVAAHWERDRVALVLLNDCTSAAPGSEAAADTFEQDMKKLGCQVVNHNDVKM